MATRIEQWKGKIKRLSDQRERNVNRYIAPIEIKMGELREKIRIIEPSYNEY